MQKKLENITPRQALKTALIVAGVLVAAAALLWYRGRSTAAAVSAGIAVLLTLIGLFVPPAAIVFHRVWFTIAFALGWVNSRIILTIIYFLVFVPYRLVSRLIGRDVLKRRQSPGPSYWHMREKTRQSKEQFERLF
jgi:hypothetical protein